MDWDFILVYATIAIFAYAVVYELFHRHWIAIPCAIAAVIIMANAIYTDDVTVAFIMFMTLILITGILFFYRLFRKKG